MVLCTSFLKQSVLPFQTIPELMVTSLNCFLFNLILFYRYECFACMRACALHVCLVPAGVRRKSEIPQD